jgi:hypothetical protein
MVIESYHAAICPTGGGSGGGVDGGVTRDGRPTNVRCEVIDFEALCIGEATAVVQLGRALRMPIEMLRVDLPEGGGCPPHNYTRQDNLFPPNFVFGHIFADHSHLT